MVYFLGYRLKSNLTIEGVDFFKIFFYRLEEQAPESLSFKGEEISLKNKRATGLAHFFGFVHKLQSVRKVKTLRANLSYF